MSGPVHLSGSVDLSPGREVATPGYKAWALTMLLLLYMMSFIDRSILNTVGQLVKADLQLTDLQLGLLGGLAFAVCNGVFSIPIARLAERVSRVKILVVSLVMWSMITALSGMANNFWHMFAARVGVGIGEAGGSAPAQSLISDYFPPNQRARALAIYVLGVPIGILVGATGSAWVAETYGWRWAFVVVGLPGIFLALLMWLTLREPPRGGTDATPEASSETPPLRAVLKLMMAKKSIVHLVAAGSIANFAAYGILQFLHPFFVREFGISSSEAALYYALLNSFPSAAGFLIGGIVVDRLAQKDARHYGWVPAIAMAMAAPMYVLAFQADGLVPTLLLLILPCLALAVYFGPTFAAIHNMVRPRMRASATAVATLFMNLIGVAAGPAFAGFLSDLFAQQAMADFATLCPGGMATPGASAEITAQCLDASATGLRQALTICALFYLWAVVHYLLASRSIRKDMAAGA